MITECTVHKNGSALFFPRASQVVRAIGNSRIGSDIAIVEKETGVECLIRERGVKDFCHFQRSIGCRGDVSAAGYAVDRT